MEGEYTTSEIYIMLSGLKEQIKTGFKETHIRLDITNGNVNENTMFRVRAETTIKLLKWLVGFLSASNVALLAEIFLR